MKRSKYKNKDKQYSRMYVRYILVHIIYIDTIFHSHFLFKIKYIIGNYFDLVLYICIHIHINKH